MFRYWANHIPAEEFLTKLIGSKYTGWGDPFIVDRPISLFVDIQAEPRQLEFHEYNILVLHTPNSISQMKEWTLENGHKFNCIITSDKDIIEKYDTALGFGSVDLDTLAVLLKEFLYRIIQDNGIPESTYWSQEMEDQWIAENLELPEHGFFLEIGGCYPKALSNSYYFEKTRKWGGIIIEPDPVYFKGLQGVRNCILEQVAISPSSEPVWFEPLTKVLKEPTKDSIKVNTARLSDVLSKHKISKIDLISIDIEGYEKEAWSTFDYKKYNPSIIITEHTEFGNYDASFTDEILKHDPNFYIAQTTPLNFILVHKNVKRK